MAGRVTIQSSESKAFKRLILFSGSLLAPLVAWAAPDPGDEPSTASAEVVEIDVSQPPLRHASEEASLASTVIESSDLHQPGASSADVLAQVPGVQVSRAGGGADLATASIRGADARQVPVYVAGIRINDDVTGTADLSSVPLWMMDRVEVFRGNAPERADRLGIGGAIFFWPRLPGAPRAGAGLEVGSFGASAQWLSYETGSERSAALVALRRSGAENDHRFVDDRGRRFDLDESEVKRHNADFRHYDLWSISRHRVTRRVRMQTVLSIFDRQQGVTGLAVVPALSARARAGRILFGGTAILDCASRSRCRLELSSSFLSARSVILDPEVELSSLRTRVSQSAGTRTAHTIRFRSALNSRSTVSASLGFAAEQLRIDRQNAMPSRADGQSLVPSLGFEHEAQSGVRLHALLSVECHFTRGESQRLQSNVETRGESCAVDEPVGRLGVSHQLSEGFEVLANLGRYQRTPTLAERYGSSSAAEGNASLEAERGLSADVGVRVQHQAGGVEGIGFALDSFVFGRNVDNLVRYRRTSTESTAPFNVAQARLYGMENALGVKLFDHARFQAALTLLEARETTPDSASDPTPNDILPFTSRLVASTLAEVYTSVDQHWLTRAGLGVRYFYRASRFADPAGQTVLPAQQLVDLEGSTSFGPASAVARLSVRNVLDSHTSDLIGFPMPGRSYHAQVEAWF